MHLVVALVALGQHGLRTEPSGAIGVAALLGRQVSLDGDGDVVVVVSGRNVDDDAFLAWINAAGVKPAGPGALTR